ncbi:hypothetical protein HPB48_009874 [Haemaphysalis longicornis]|uniref:Transposable element P transposase-like RNase H domain-containing protein n=1 Tax=Haemaphysalis longicornis TaxID=44386 RepID=A0A9J6GHY1_HAELO|nr:hypothetical protein HPB48_009874 [Haemaphysalis longicornis]
MLTSAPGQRQARHLGGKPPVVLRFTGIVYQQCIPVGYFFTRCLKNDKLFRVTIEVLNGVEDVGVLVTRVLTADHQTNTALLMRLSGGGLLVDSVPHHLKKGDSLFLTFSPIIF